MKSCNYLPQDRYRVVNSLLNLIRDYKANVFFPLTLENSSTSFFSISYQRQK